LLAQLLESKPLAPIALVQLLDPRQEAPLHLPEQTVDLLTAGTPGLDAVRVGTGMTEIDQQIDFLIAQAEQMLRADPGCSQRLDQPEESTLDGPARG
jgi:hypothetical protein